jgi:hypothetical protein
MLIRSTGLGKAELITEVVAAERLILYDAPERGPRLDGVSKGAS